MDIIVQKFGGTSLANQKTTLLAVQKVNRALQKNKSVVVVVSAIGRQECPYSTDSLMDFIGSYRASIKARELDMLLNCGEIISAVNFSSFLDSIAISNLVLNGLQAGIITDDNYNCAKIIEVKPERILKHLKEKKIVIVPGFQGVTRDFELTTLGRGGSDITAVALAEALNAEKVEIYTDVDGIKTADPKLVKDAKTIDEISYEEIFNLASEGAKVIHPDAIGFAMKKNIPVEVKSTFSEKKGTMICSKEEKSESRGVITAVTYKKNIDQVIINMGVGQKSNNLKTKIFDRLAKENISLDFINIDKEKIVFTVNNFDTLKVRLILEDFTVEYRVLEKCAKVSAVGSRMFGIPGVMADIVSALEESSIDILQTADSHTTIWSLIKEENLEKAVCVLHRKFKLT